MSSDMSFPPLCWQINEASRHAVPQARSGRGHSLADARLGDLKRTYGSSAQRVG